MHKLILLFAFLFTACAYAQVNTTPIYGAPAAGQTITQPSGTDFAVVTSGGGKETYNGNEVCTAGNAGCAPINNPSFTGTLGFGSGWDLGAESNTAPLGWGTLPWSGTGNYSVVDQSGNYILSDVAENDSLAPMATAASQRFVNNGNTWVGYGVNGADFYMEYGNSFGNYANTIWGPWESSLWADDSSAHAGLTVGAGYNGATCFHFGDPTLRPFDAQCQAFGNKSVFYFQDASPTIAPARTLTQAIRQTNLTFSQGTTLTSVAGTANNMTINGSFAGGGSNAYANWGFVLTGTTNPANVGAFHCTGSSTTQLTGCDLKGVAETFPAGAKLQSFASWTTYVGTITGGAHNAYAVQQSPVTVAGFINSGNNTSTAYVIASSATAILLLNTSGVNETHAGTIISTNAHSSTKVVDRATYNTGSASATDDFTTQNVIGGLTANPTATRVHTHTGTSGFVSESWSYPTAFTQIIPSGSLPTMAAGAAAGTSPTCTTVTGVNMSGTISCTTGTATTTGVLATITFNPALSVAPNACLLFPANATTIIPVGSVVWTAAPSRTTWTVNVGAVALTVNNAYKWSYHCE